VTVGPAAANGPTCTRQCHEFGGAVDPGDDETRAQCVSEAIGCRWIQHPTNPAVGKCGRLCAEFQVESNCQLAGYGSCRYATQDVTGGDPKCTKQCADITDADWCTGASCIWTATGTCRRKCIEFQMQGPCESIGCTWVTPADGYALSQCIPPSAPATAPTVTAAPAAAEFVNTTSHAKAFLKATLDEKDHLLKDKKAFLKASKKH